MIVDEIHAIAADKRGAHLALSLERFDALTRRRLQRIGLSATQRPIEEVAKLLVGVGGISGRRAARLRDRRRRTPARSRPVDRDDRPRARADPHPRAPRGDLRAHRRARCAAHRTTIVFVNTRRLVERVAHELTERLGEGKVAAHHGSLSRKTRLAAEEGLKSGAVSVVVATASLELGIDVGHVDLVCHLGAPRSIADPATAGRPFRPLSRRRSEGHPVSADARRAPAVGRRGARRAPGGARPAEHSRKPARHPRPADRRHRRGRGRSRSTISTRSSAVPIRFAISSGSASTKSSIC